MVDYLALWRNYGWEIYEQSLCNMQAYCHYVAASHHYHTNFLLNVCVQMIFLNSIDLQSSEQLTDNQRHNVFIQAGGLLSSQLSIIIRPSQKLSIHLKSYFMCLISQNSHQHFWNFWEFFLSFKNIWCRVLASSVH